MARGTRVVVLHSLKHRNVEAGRKAGSTVFSISLPHMQEIPRDAERADTPENARLVANAPNFPQRVRLLRQHGIRPDVRELLTRWLLHAPVTSKLLETVIVDIKGAKIQGVIGRTRVQRYKIDLVRLPVRSARRPVAASRE